MHHKIEKHAKHMAAVKEGVGFVGLAALPNAESVKIALISLGGVELASDEEAVNIEFVKKM